MLTMYSRINYVFGSGVWVEVGSLWLSVFDLLLVILPKTFFLDLKY